jgi:transcription initiation factor TFIIIB Brf1 subunit/transcription initiation factor TFIIB
MSEFEAYESLFAAALEVKESDPKEPTTCKHTEVVTDGGVITCTECGKQLRKNILHDKEWRFYTDGRKSGDPNRVQVRKIEDRNIFKDVENMGFNEKIVQQANVIYNQVTKGQIFRGNSRKAIVFACIFHAYKLSGHPQGHEDLISIFDLSRKDGLKGLKHVNLNAPKDHKIHVTYITPSVLIDNVIAKFNGTEQQKQDVRDLYARVKNRSSKLNRARPQSVAAGIVWHWIQSHDKLVTLKQFAQTVELSELTIGKISKEVNLVLTPSSKDGSDKA